MLKLKNITKTFPGVFEPVLKGISLELNTGDFCVVIGANGSGKSTLMKVIAGEYPPDTGEIEIHGKTNGKPLIAQVVQDVNKGTIPEMTLLENMALSQMRVKRPRLAFYTRTQETVLQKMKALPLGLEAFLHQPLSCLSGGQRQTIATLMAIHSGGQLLLLDEHTSALDPQMQGMLMAYTVKAITEAKLTTLMITHKMDDAIRYGNRLIMLHQGNIVFQVSGKEKAALTTPELLALFHTYEDLTLRTEVPHEH